MEAEVGNELSQRLNGPFSLRLLLQPSMALLFAIRDGRKDAASNATPYLQALRGQKKRTQGYARVGMGFTQQGTGDGRLLDCAFQYATGGSIRIFEALLMACILCAVPYTLMRGPAARIASRKS